MIWAIPGAFALYGLILIAAPTRVRPSLLELTLTRRGLRV
jgi:hypothetical protein